MAYFTSGYVDNAIGTAVRQAVAPTTAAFNQFEEQARTRVQEAASMAGYSLPNTSSDAQLKLLALGQWVLLAYGLNKGIDVSPAMADSINMLSQIRQGNAPLLNFSPNTRDGIGGVKFSDTSETSTSGRPARMNRSELKEW